MTRRVYKAVGRYLTAQLHYPLQNDNVINSNIKRLVGPD